MTGGGVDGGTDDGGSDGPGDGEDDEVVFDLVDWDEVRRGALEGLLAEERVAYRWDLIRASGGWSVPGTSGPESAPLQAAHLVVGLRHADLVEELIDELDHPDALAAEDDDGDDAGAEVLSALYVAADVLCSAPGHAQAAEELLDAARVMGEVDAPYGLDPVTWAELGRRVEHLAARLREGDDEQAVVDAARQLRQAVHPLV